MNLMLIMESWGAGGTEQYVKSLYSTLKTIDSKFVIHLLLLRDQLPNEGLSCQTWIDNLFVLNGSKIRRWVKLARLVRDVKPDVCHLHLYTSTLAAAVAVKLASNSELIATFHSPISQWKWRHRIAFRTAVSLCDGVIGALDFTAQQLRKWRFDCVSASPPVAIDEASNRDFIAVAKATSSNGRLNIVGCGRLSPEKNWETLIAALAKCQGVADGSIRCELIGSGPLRDRLTEQIKSAGLQDRVHLAGRLSHQETLHRIASADLFVLPSRFEGFGMAAVEAMAMGVPTITADFPASLEYISHGTTGHRFPASNVDSLGNLIQWHFENRDKSRRIGQAGKESVAGKFSPMKIAWLHHEIYSQRD